MFCKMARPPSQNSQAAIWARRSCCGVSIGGRAGLRLPPKPPHCTVLCTHKTVQCYTAISRLLGQKFTKQQHNRLYSELLQNEYWRTKGSFSVVVSFTASHLAFKTLCVGSGSRLMFITRLKNNSSIIIFIIQHEECIIIIPRHSDGFKRA
jgi:hypothetical protein